MPSGPVLGTTVLAVLATVIAAGAEQQFETQGPWSYWKRSNGPGDNIVTYLASVRSAQDPEVFFVIACEARDVVTASLMHGEAFSYVFNATPVRIDVSLDNGPDMMVTAALVQQMQLTIHPRFARELVPLFSRSRTLSAFVLGRDGETHGYHFRLQPNDLALRDIEVNCFRQRS